MSDEYSDVAPEPTTRAGRELLKSFQSPDEPFTNVVVKIGIAAIEAAARLDADEDIYRARLETDQEILRLERALQRCEEGHLA